MTPLSVPARCLIVEGHAGGVLTVVPLVAGIATSHIVLGVAGFVVFGFGTTGLFRGRESAL
jgi:hypothetical protein